MCSMLGLKVTLNLDEFFSSTVGLSLEFVAVKKNLTKNLKLKTRAVIGEITTTCVFTHSSI